MKTLDLIIPVYNEEEVLDHLFLELKNVFNTENLIKYQISRVKFIFIDDGSKDKSSFMIKEFLEEVRCGQLIRFSRNFGHQNAVTAGLDNAFSDIVGLIDADLQDPPEVILRMAEKMKDNYDVVYGVRQKRKENVLKVFCYWLYYRILAYFSDLTIALDSGDFLVMNSMVVNAIRALPEKIRYPRGLKTWVGYRQIGFEYERYARAAGETKYSFKKLYDLATNGITSLSTKPLRITQFFALVFSFSSILLAVFILTLILTSKVAENVYFYITYLLIFITGSVIMMSLYVISAYVGRTYIEVKGRPTYIAMENITWGSSE